MLPRTAFWRWGRSCDYRVVSRGPTNQSFPNTTTVTRKRLDGDLLRDPKTTVWVGGAMLALAALAALALVVFDDPQVLFRFDTWWRNTVQPPAGWAHNVSEVFYYLGLGWFTIPFRIVVGLWLARRRRWFDLGAWLGAWAIADILTAVLKIGVERPRPDLSDNLSFPSGHTKSASQISVGLVLLMIPPWSRRWPAWTACAIATGAMALSRIILDKHWASDVISGALLGISAALLAAAISQLYRNKRSSDLR